MMNKETLRTKIKEWLVANGIDAGVHIQWWHGESKPDYITIHNGFGALNKNQQWLNKITLHYYGWPLWKIRYAIARTDKNFLSPTPENFRQFIVNLFDVSTDDKGE